MIAVISTFRSLIMCAIYPVYLIACSMVFIVVNIMFSSRAIDNRVIRFWAIGTCKMFGVSVELTGTENIPPSGCLFLFNHTSFFDIFALSAVLPNIRFGAKKELFSIPIFGKAMERAGILFIDRSDRFEVAKIYEKNRERILRGEKFALAPEGARQVDEILAPFKTGPFVFAISARAPIVPIVIKKASAVLSKKSYIPNPDVLSRTISIEILKPISTEGYEFESRHDLQKKVYEIMKPYFTVRQV